MKQDVVNFEAVRELALALRGVEEGTMYGFPALKLNGALLACVTIHKSAEHGSLGVRIDRATREGLIEAEPDIYYVTPHYVNSPTVLVRMARIHRDALEDLLKSSWRFVASQPRARMRAPAASRPRTQRPRQPRGA